MLTKRDHLRIVNIFNCRKTELFNERERGKAEMKADLISDFIGWLEEDNPDFDADKFINAVHIF